jgi:hypothetical protein
VNHQGHSAARRIMSMKNSNDTIGNRTRDLSKLRYRVPHLAGYIAKAWSWPGMSITISVWMLTSTPPYMSMIWALCINTGIWNFKVWLCGDVSANGECIWLLVVSVNNGRILQRMLRNRPVLWASLWSSVDRATRLQILKIRLYPRTGILTTLGNVIRRSDHVSVV